MNIPTLPISRVMPTLLLVLGLAGATVAQAGQFAITAINPSVQSVSVGDFFSVDLTFQPGTLPTNAVRTPIAFNSSIIQFVSASSTYGGAIFNTTNSATGLLNFELSGGTGTVATFDFMALSPGTSSIDINPEQFIIGFGWFGINGLAVDGVVHVTGSAPAVPDAAPTLVLLGGALIGLSALRRRRQA